MRDLKKVSFFFSELIVHLRSFFCICRQLMTIINIDFLFLLPNLFLLFFFSFSPTNHQTVKTNQQEREEERRREPDTISGELLWVLWRHVRRTERRRRV